jgi:hypothetical protein
VRCTRALQGHRDRGQDREGQPEAVRRPHRRSLREALERANIPARVEGREKDPYSIYQKMRRKKISLGEIVDVYGFRIVVDKVDTCYRTIGVVHSAFKPMPGRFKDYIAIPASNGYQSLHTTAVRSERHADRSADPHRGHALIAESGIAAHWQYKEGGAPRSACKVTVRANGCSSSSTSSRAATPRNSSKVFASTCFRTRFTCSRRKAKSAVCRAARPASTLPTPCTPMSAIAASRQGRSSPRAAAHAAAQWPDRRDHHGEGCNAESGMGQLRGDGQGARVDPQYLKNLKRGEASSSASAC